MALSEQLLRESWLHSHEEDEGDAMVFRPSTFAFPPSRGRHGFSLNPDGTAVLTGPDQADRATSGSGQWHIEEPNRLVIDSPEVGNRAFEITSASPEKLVLRRAF